VAELYIRIGNLRGAVNRLREVLKVDPNYTNRDAAYFDLAEIYFKTDNKDRALPWYQKLVDEFTQSEYLEKAQERLKVLKAK